MSKIRIAKLFYTFDVETAGGGVSLYATELGAQLDKQRFDLRLYSMGFYDSPRARKRMEMLNAAGCRAFTATQWDERHAYKSLLRAFFSLHKHLKYEPVDILHSHSEYTDILTLMLKLSGRARRIMRTIHTAHRHEWVIRPVVRTLLTNFLYPILFDVEVAINQANIDRLDNRTVARIWHRKAEKIHNAILLERFKEITEVKARKCDANLIALKESLGIPSDVPVIGSVGRLAQEKGYSHFVEAAAIILQQLHQAHFLLVGDGNLRQELVQQAHDIGIEKHIIFTGSRSDVVQLLQCMDIFVSSSLWEGLPTVVMEAMACHIPVVATNIPGTRELVKHQVSGILVPAANSQALAQGVLQMLIDPELSQQMAQGALAALPDFSIERVAEQYEELYVRLAGK